MKLGIMQPYFFPYLGYFALIKHTDQWVVFDTPQFIRHGWIERNRILKPGDRWQYIKVPLEKHKRETPINEIKIRANENWQEKIIAQLGHYKKKARGLLPYVRFAEDAVSFETEYISKLNIHLLRLTCDYLGLKFDYSVFSELDFDLGPVNEPDEWALKISKALDANEYYNPPGGSDFFNKEKYERNNISLKLLQLNLKEYDQRRKTFEPGLSIVDVMMFNPIKRIRDFLDLYELV